MTDNERIRLSVPPKDPISEITRDYGQSFNLLLLPSSWGPYLSLLKINEEYERLHGRDLLRIKESLPTTFDLPSFIKLGLSNLKEGSIIKERLIEISQQVLLWLENWVDKKDSRGVDRDKPMFEKALFLARQNALESGKQFDESKWWDDLRFVRFLYARGSTASIMVNRERGIDTTTLIPDIVDRLITEVRDKNRLLELLRLRRGPDLDFLVFPTELYETVFKEFVRLRILRKALGNRGEIIKIKELTGDEKEKYDIGVINEDDVVLPPGYKLENGRLICTYSKGKIKQNNKIPYHDIVFSTKIINPETGDSFDYPVFTMEFMPSIVDETVIEEDGRTGASACLLSQTRDSGIFVVSKGKLLHPVSLKPEDVNVLEKTGCVFKMAEVHYKALCLPDRPVGEKLEEMARGIDFDHGLVATLVGRSLRSALMNSLNIKGVASNPIDPITDKGYEAFKSLVDQFDPSLVPPENKTEMDLGLMHGLFLDFPFLMSYLEKTGFAKHFVFGQDEKIFQAMRDIATEVEKLGTFKHFWQRLEEVKMRQIQSEKPEGQKEPERFNEEDIDSMIKTNITEVAKLIREDGRIPDFFKQGKSDLELILSLFEMPKFRELPQEEVWGGEFKIKLSDFNKLLPAVVQISKENGFRIFGYTHLQENGELVYHMTRYPRTRRYTIQQDYEYEKALEEIAEILDVKNTLKIESWNQERRFRVVLGLNRGYSNVSISADELKEFLGKDFQYKEGKIMAVNGKNIYQEPALIIEGDIKDLKKIFLAAHLADQQRFSVELLGERKAYMVETSHCENPDP
jgi:hypothetical protein